MPFVFQTKQGFITVDSKPKMGLYTQFYTKEGFSKATSLLSFPSNNYSATLDAHHRLHVVTQNNKNQIIYITYEQGHISRNIILDDPKQLYDFNNLYITCLNTSIYLFYTAKSINGTSRTLVWQTLNESIASSPQTLLTALSPESVIKFFCIEDILYIMHTGLDMNYALYLTSFSQSSYSTSCILHSDFPIIDYNLCQSSSQLYLVIQKDTYGQQQLSFLSLNTQQETVLTLSSSSFHSPCIFSYFNFLWITYMSKNILYVMISNQQYSTFSVSIPSSIQIYISPCHYTPLSHALLSATQLNIQLSPYIRIPIVCHFDLTGIHPDLPISGELDLLFDALELSYDTSSSDSMSYTTSSSSYAPTPIPEASITPQPPKVNNVPLSTPTLAPPTVPLSSQALHPSISTTPPSPLTPSTPMSPSSLTSAPSSTPSPTLTTPINSFVPFTFEVQSNPFTESPPPSNKTTSHSSLKAMGKAFMENPNGFELPPMDY